MTDGGGTKGGLSKQVPWLPSGPFPDAVEPWITRTLMDTTRRRRTTHRRRTTRRDVLLPQSRDTKRFGGVGHPGDPRGSRTQSLRVVPTPPPLTSPTLGWEGREGKRKGPTKGEIWGPWDRPDHSHPPRPSTTFSPTLPGHPKSRHKKRETTVPDLRRTQRPLGSPVPGPLTSGSRVHSRVSGAPERGNKHPTPARKTDVRPSPSQESRRLT